MMWTLTKDIVESINIYFAQKVVRSQRRRVGEWFSFENNLFWHSKKKNDLPRNESSSCHNSHSVEIQGYFLPSRFYVKSILVSLSGISMTYILLVTVAKIDLT